VEEKDMLRERSSAGALLIALLLAGCGTPASTSNGGSCAISPTSALLRPGGTQEFTAAVTGAISSGVVWSASCGTLAPTSMSGNPNATTYTAPDLAGSCTVTATSVVDATKSASALVTVASAPGVAVAISPPTASVTVGRSQLFTATVTGSSNSAVTWRVQDGPACGTVTQAGTYTAPAAVPSPPTCHVLATSAADPAVSAAAAATVLPPTAGIPSMPHISVGKPAFASEGTASLLTDGAYRYPNTWTFAPAHCSSSTPCWGAVHVGVGPSRLLVDWSHQDGDDQFTTTSYGGTTVQSYSIEVSANSTNGSDGNWATATDAITGKPASVNGNVYIQRSHVIDFSGYSWVRMKITASTADEIDELDLWDASIATDDSYFFHGDSITVQCANVRGTGGDYGQQPSFQADVHNAFPAHYPLQTGGGIAAEGANDAASEIPMYLSDFRHNRHWFLTMGTNDLCGGATAYAQYAQAWLAAVKAAGHIPILVHPIWGNNVSAYCSGNGPAFNKAIDTLVAANNLMPAVPLYEATFGHPEYFDPNDVHPNSAGCAVWRQTFASFVASLYAP
jgi:lysophospholipase L1-like esterase